MMHTSRQNLFTRDDTFFGVCEGLSQDLRIPGTLLRLGFTLGLFFNPVAATGAYLAAGLVVLLSRLIVPEPRVASALPAESDTQPAAATPEPVQAGEELMPLAA